ncbi:MAG: hypothetical protein LC799_19505, partial [Actinobacteria bacterium]|nr:hypothetical protein [Actinomycetota bacterium]
VLFDGIDPFADPAGPAGYACRYDGGGGRPCVRAARRTPLANMGSPATSPAAVPIAVEVIGVGGCGDGC